MATTSRFDTMPRPRHARRLGQDALNHSLRSASGQVGASYIEVLVTFLLLALVVAALIPLLLTGQEGYDEVRRRQDMIQNARVAMDKILRELRAAESYRLLSSGLLRFTLSWGDGTGSAPTVEYSLNGATSELEYRWKDDWDYRQQIIVTAPNAVAPSYAVMLTFDHAALVSAGKSLTGGNDVRIRYWNGSTMIELDRMLDPRSGWNRTDTRIWFRLQAAMATGAISSNYYLHYGNPSAGSPPANGDNIFLDYEDGTTLDGWTRRDTRSGSYDFAPSDGFIFQASTTNGYRELSKSVAHGDVEVFWGFRSLSSSNNSRQVGMGARLSDAGVGYRVTPGDGGGNRLRILFWSSWGSSGGSLADAIVSISANTDYYGRFYLVGSLLQAKVWQASAAEPGWQVTVTDGQAATGNHYGQVDGTNVALDHRHRTLIVRPRVPIEPLLVLGIEEAGIRSDALAALAGPFRSMTVSCFDVTGNAVACSPTNTVRSVQVALVVYDPDGRIPDINVTGRAYRQMP